MGVFISSVSNQIEIKLVDNDNNGFTDLKIALGFDFFDYSFKQKTLRFSHFDLFNNFDKVSRVITGAAPEYDDSFWALMKRVKDGGFLENASQITSTAVQNSIKPFFKRSLKDFQLHNVCRLVERKSGATFSVPGAGKTSEILAAYCYFKSTNPSLKLFVIAPTNAVSAWDEEVGKCLKNHCDYNKDIKNKSGKSFVGQMAFISGGLDNAKHLMDQNPDMSIITYHSNHEYEKEVADFVSRNDGNIFCAVDESHRIKGYPGKKMNGEDRGVLSFSVLNLAGMFKHKFVMSGTPMPQEPKDLKSQFGFLYPERLNKGDYYQKLKAIYVRTTKKDIGLKSFNTIERLVPMSKDHQKLYDAIKEDQKKVLLSTRTQVNLKKLKSCIMYLLQIASNPRIVSDPGFKQVVDRLGLSSLVSESSEKFKAVCKLTNELVSKGEKVLIWTNFVKNIDLLEAELSHLNPVYIDGRIGTGPADEVGTRKHKIQKFKTDPSCKVFIANPAAASEGISLHINDKGEKVCSNAIYLDRNFNSSQFLQSVDRIHRIGSKETPNVYIFKTTNSLDMRVQERLDEKVTAMMKLLEDVSLAPYILNEEFHPKFENDAGQHIQSAQSERVTKEETKYYTSLLESDD